MPAEPYTKVNFKSSNQFNLRRDQLEATPESSLSMPQRKKLFDTWALIVQAYSQADLTNQGDKLIALSAVAREMQPLMQCRYLAGHWETDLIRQLGWPGFDIEARPTEYRAPSWSWASTNGRNQYFYWMYDCVDQYYPLTMIIKAEIDLVSDDPLGAVKGGCRTVRGQLYQVELREKEDVDADGVVRKSGQPLSILGRETDLRFHKDGRDTHVEDPLYCVLLSLSLGKEPTMQGLMLQPTGQADTYQRVGSIEPAIGECLRRDDEVLGMLGGVDWDHDGNHHFWRRGKHGSNIFKIV